MGGVVDGIALEIEQASAAATMGPTGLTPAPMARLTAIGVEIRAAAVFEAAYDSTNPRTALTAKIVHAFALGPRVAETPAASQSANPLRSRPTPRAIPPPNRNTTFQSIP